MRDFLMAALAGLLAGSLALGVHDLIEHWRKG